MTPQTCCAQRAHDIDWTAYPHYRVPSYTLA